MPRVNALSNKYRVSDTSKMIKAFMVIADKTQQDMADALGISRQAYSKKLINCQFTLRDMQIIIPELKLTDKQIVGLITGREETNG